MSIVIDRDNNANAIFISDANGAQFLNNLQAFQDNPTDSTLSILDISRNIELFSDILYSEFEDSTGNQWGTDGQTTTNNLNAMFTNTGGFLAPVITSSLTVSLTQGDSLNYELTADNDPTEIEWDLSTAPDLVPNNANRRFLIDGTNLASGIYSIPVAAINMKGRDSQTITLTVSTPPFTNTKSVLFNNTQFANLTANTSNPFYRLNQNSATAWSFSLWFKPINNNNQNQSILSFGGNDQNNEGRVHIRYKGNNSARRRMSLFYGTNFNNLELQTPVGSTTAGTWAHWLFVYDGGTTENGSGGLSTSFSRFKIYKNGVLQTTTNSHSNFGFSGGIVPDFFRFSRFLNSGQYSRGSTFDEPAIWASDQSANASAIYGSGSPFDLNTLTTVPDYWWRFGDGDTFPTLTATNGGLDATITNGNQQQIVNDVP